MIGRKIAAPPRPRGQVDAGRALAQRLLHGRAPDHAHEPSVGVRDGHAEQGVLVEEALEVLDRGGVRDPQRVGNHDVAQRPRFGRQQQVADAQHARQHPVRRGDIGVLDVVVRVPLAVRAEIGHDVAHGPGFRVGEVLRDHQAAGGIRLVAQQAAGDGGAHRAHALEDGLRAAVRDPAEEVGLVVARQRRDDRGGVRRPEALEQPDRLRRGERVEHARRLVRRQQREQRVAGFVVEPVDGAARLPGRQRIEEREDFPGAPPGNQLAEAFPGLGLGGGEARERSGFAHGVLSGWEARKYRRRRTLLPPPPA
jgi:hypothetical protein